MAARTQAAGVPLTAGQRDLLGRALSDALDWRTPSGGCADCDTGAGLCLAHTADAVLCAAYRALGAELGIEAGS
jgi:hypothetical protein